MATTPEQKQKNREKAKAWRDKNLEKCRAREKEWDAKNRKKRNAISQEWRDRNREQYNAISRANHERRKEAHLAQSREWKARNPEKIRAWLDRNPEKLAATGRRYREKHPEKVLTDAAIRRTRITKGKIVRFTADQLRARLSMFGNRCWMCGKEADQVDHVIPLARGGPHILANLRPACGKCNRKKGARRHHKELAGVS